MKITVSQLRRIIKEEVESVTQAASAFPRRRGTSEEYGNKNQQLEDVLDMLSMATNQDREDEAVEAFEALLAKKPPVGSGPKRYWRMQVDRITTLEPGLKAHLLDLIG